MTNKENNIFENSDRLLLPLWTRMDEFEEFLVMDDKIFHVTDFVDNPWEHWTDTMYFYNIDWNNIIVQCLFYQDYAREEDEKERTETTYLAVDKIFTKGLTNIEDAENYEDWELTIKEVKWNKELIRLATPHLIEEDKEDRTPEAIAKIKSFLFYQALWKKKAKKLIEYEIGRLWDKISEEDLKELNEIKETWCIKREKHYVHLYSFRAMRDMAKETWNPELEDIEKLIKEMEEDGRNNPN